jgi:hypothetical protein
MMKAELAAPLSEEGPVIFRAPADGWSRETYQQAIREFTEARGRAPATITMHPQTLAAVMRSRVWREAQIVTETVREVVQREAEVLERVLDRDEEEIRVRTDLAHARETIVMT